MRRFALGLVLAAAPVAQDAAAPPDPQAAYVEQLFATLASEDEQALRQHVASAPFRALRVVHDGIGQAVRAQDPGPILTSASRFADALAAQGDPRARAALDRHLGGGVQRARTRREYEEAFWAAVGSLESDPGLAESSCEDALALAAELEESFLVVDAGRLLSYVQLERGANDSALDSTEAALVEAQAAGLWDVVADLQLRHGIVLWKLGRLDAALASLLACRESAVRASEPVREFDALYQLVSLHSVLGDASASRAAAAEGLERVARLADRSREGALLANLAGVESGAGRYAESLRLLERAAAAFGEAGDAHGAGRVLTQIGGVHSEVGRAQDAERTLRLAVSRFPANAHADRARARLALGLARIDAGQAAGALDVIDEALVDLREHGTPVDMARAEQLRGMGLLACERFDEAVSAFESSLAGRPIGSDPFGRALSATGLGDALFELGRSSEAERAYGIALEAARAAPTPEASWRAHTGLGRVHAAAGEPEAARSEFRLAVGEVEAIRGALTAPALRVRYLGDKLDLYRRAALLEVAAGDLDAGWRLAGLCKARTLVELGAYSPEEPAGTSTLGELRALESALTFVELRLRDAAHLGVAREELVARRERLRGEHAAARLAAELADPRLARLTGAAGAPSPDVVRAALPQDAAVVEYLVGPDSSGAFVVASGDLTFVPLPISHREVDELVARVLQPFERLRGGHTDPWNLGFDIGAARELHERLVAPLGLPAGVALWTVPDGPLRRLPFALLVTEHEKRRVDPRQLYAQYAGCRFLIEARALGTLPTSALLVRSEPRPPRARSLVVADPSPTPASLRSLDCDAEVDALRRVFSGAVDVLEREDATEARFRALAPHASYLHFATHGELDDHRPAYSRLALAPGEGHDGWLFAWEIERLRLGAELAMLSACDTVGVAGRGEGRLGLARAFLAAGTSSVVASHWRVDDRATSEWMATFATELGAGATPAGAVRAAQLATLRGGRAGVSHAHPFFWAGFELVGRP